MNSVVLIGRLAKDIDLRFVPASGMAVAKILLAVDKDLFGEKKQQAVAQGKPTADFIYITTFGKIAENVANYLKKGSQCSVQGRITTNNYIDKNGEKQHKTGVTADKVEFIGSKNGQVNQTADDDEYNFTPVADDEEIPF